MIRKLILVLAILTVAAVPPQAREHEFGGGHERFEHFERFHHFYSYAYAPRCWWQEGYWANQPYVDAYGRYSYAPQWVPGQWVCY